VTRRSSLPWLATAACASSLLVAPPTAAIAQTAGGLVPGGIVRVVTSLADSGPGSLRQAVTVPGPSVVVFAVGGYVDLAAPLVLDRNRVTVAGETAPGPGIVIRGGTVAIRASDVVLSHVAVYPGATPDPKLADNRDAINLVGSVKRGLKISRVRLDHVSTAWGVDENIDLQGPVDDVRIVDSLIGEPLMQAGHPKRIHSMNLLIGSGVGRVDLSGNLFVAGNQRNPRLVPENRVSMRGNVVAGWGNAAAHLDMSQTPPAAAGAFDVVGNVFEPGPDSRCKTPPIRIDPAVFAAVPAPSVHVGANLLLDPEGRCRSPATTDADPARLAPAPTLGAADRTVPLERVREQVLADAGARPRARNPIDARIVATVRSGQVRLVGDETAVGGYPALEPTRTSLVSPIAGGVLRDEADVATMRRWLCEAARKVAGGAACR
jgi:hypothetical protein